MSVISEISRTILAIRRVHDCDIERLCFEVTEAEWQELLRWLDNHGWTPNQRGGDVISHPEHLTVLGIRVRKQPRPGGASE